MISSTHGTTSGYRYGCRCEPCKKAHSSAQAGWRVRARQNREPSKHGLSGYTNYKCRCETCKESYSAYKRKQTYGLSPEDVSQLLSSQKGLCPLCTGDITTRYVVDHSHRTGTVRGLLCQSCNQALGKFQDDPKVIRAAIEYLNQRDGNTPLVHK